MACSSSLEVFDSQNADHVKLLVLLFIVCLAQAVIAIFGGFHLIFFAVGITLPPVAIPLILLRSNRQRIGSFFGNILTIDRTAYVIIFSAKLIALLVSLIYLFVSKDVNLDKDIALSLSLICSVVELLFMGLLLALLGDMRHQRTEEGRRLLQTRVTYRRGKNGAESNKEMGILPSGNIAYYAFERIDNEQVTDELDANGELLSGHVTIDLVPGEGR